MRVRQRDLRLCCWKMDAESSRQGVASKIKTKDCNLVLDRWELPLKPLLRISTAFSDPIRVLSRLS